MARVPGDARRIGARACLVAALVLCVAPPCADAGRRTSDALGAALRDPGTWVPAVAALVVGLSGRDHSISDAARMHTPVFRSHDGAIEASDVLRETSYVGMVATVPLIPGAESSMDPWRESMFAEHVGLASAMGVTWVLKRSVGRERPDRSNDHSFPSGHASRAFAARGAIAYNLGRSTLADPARIGADVVLSLVATGTAWARVEGGAHHVTDALAGAALGNLLGRFCAEALGPDEDRPAEPRRPAGFPAVAVTFRF